MSLASVSSTAFSLQTERTFLERNNTETEAIKLIDHLDGNNTRSVIQHFIDHFVIKRLQIGLYMRTVQYLRKFCSCCL